MYGIWTIFRRETLLSFASLIPYLIAAAFLLLTGLTFYADLTFAITNRPSNPAAVPSFLALALIFFAPMLTMRSFSEEKREGTMELLLTAPVTDTAIVIGKFLSAWFYYSLLLAITLIYQIILVNVSQPDIGHTVAAYVGIWLYGAAALSVGLLFSAATENQIVAAFLSSATLLVFYLGDLVGEVVPNIEAAIVIRALSFQGHFSTSFAIGVVLLEDIVYFASVVTIALFICTRIVESERWQ